MDHSITSLIDQAEKGERAAVDELFAVLYAELHRLASRQLGRNPGRLTMGTTTLLHEAYLDMSSREGAVFADRARFMAYAARTMRGLIIDQARARRAGKRGGSAEDLRLDDMLGDDFGDKEHLSGIGEALDALATVDPSAAQVVDLKYFCGFSFTEIAALWNCSERTVRRHWEKARLYLHNTIGKHS